MATRKTAEVLWHKGVWTIHYNERAEPLVNFYGYAPHPDTSDEGLRQLAFGYLQQKTGTLAWDIAVELRR